MLHNMLRAAAGAAWSPAELFANGEKGAWYEVRPEHLYQDEAGTIPVTADGDPVGFMTDLSGNGKHATQSENTKKPIYKTNGNIHWLSSDGVDDFLVAGVDFDDAVNLNMTARLNYSNQGTTVPVDLSNSVSLNGFITRDTSFDYRVYDPQATTVGDNDIIGPDSSGQVYNHSIVVKSGVFSAYRDGLQIGSSITVNPISADFRSLYIFSARGNVLFSAISFYGVIITDDSSSESLEKINDYLGRI